MINEPEMEVAYNNLALSDYPFATAKAELENSEILRKRVRMRVFLMAEGTVAEKNAVAETASDTIAADERYIKAVEAYEKIRGRRQTWQLTIDIFRTLEASRRRT